MSISFVRIDDRMIHGQTCTRWALEYPCDGIVAVNDAAANNSVLKAAYKSASGKKTFVWTYEEWKQKCNKVLQSKDRYFLITKETYFNGKKFYQMINSIQELKKLLLDHVMTDPEQ